MSDETRGLRTLPPALLIAFAVWFAMMIARLVFMLTVKEPWGAVRFNLVNEGTGFACQAAALLGTLALARRVTGQAGLGIKVAAIGFAAALVMDVGYTFLNFMEKAWEHEWIFKTFDYAFWGAWLLVPIGLAIANWRERRELAIFIVFISLLLWPPAFLAKPMFSWLPSGKTGYAIDAAFRAIRVGFLFVGFASVARGAAVVDRALAASGLRLAAKALWLRVIAALGVVLLTLMVIAGKGSEGSLGVLKLATFTALIINFIALCQFGIGALRAGRGEVGELGRWPLVLGGGASLWAAGVMLAQMTWLYKMLYKTDSLYGSSRDLAEYAQALSLAMPLIITGGIALIAVAISGMAARHANEELRAHAQAKGAGFVTLTLVSVAIQSWMLPKATSMGSFAMLSLLAAGAGLVAIVMMAKLLNLGAEELEREPGLPPAQVLSDGT